MLNYNENRSKIKVIVVCGPTASGKTALALKLAEIFNGVIVGADSMQVYKGMDIATAMPTKAERERIEHRMIAFLEPTESFSVAEYVSLAIREIIDVSNSGKIPILCGGTGLYINSLIDGITFDKTSADMEFRNKMLSLAKEKGNEFLLKMLAEVDEKSAESLHPNNLKRIIRALEIHHISGSNMTESKVSSRNTESIIEPCIIGIDFVDRNQLYERINLRVDLMVEQGLIEEARRFYSIHNTATSAQAIGYKELLPYIKGEKTLEECLTLLKQKTRNYAKRQLTWFRKDNRINWYKVGNNDSFQNIVNFSEKMIAFFLNM